MATGKRYYWMKLKESFMTSDTIDYFMSQPDGANYVVLYQMLCLKTINTDGRLSRQIGEIIIPFDSEKIQRDCKWFSIDTVRVALNLYQQVGLIYEDIDGTLVLADHANLVGSETDAAARMRSSRANRVSQNGVTMLQQSDKIVTPDIENRVKRLDKDLNNTISDDIVCSTDVQQVANEWNKLELAQVRDIKPNTNRYKLLQARLKEYGLPDVLTAIQNIKLSAFLRGQNKNGWMVTFDWLLKPNNFIKVLEGNYSDNQALNIGKKSTSFDLSEYDKLTNVNPILNVAKE